MNKVKFEFLNTKDYLVGGKHQSAEAITLKQAAITILSELNKSEVDLSYKHFYTLCEFYLNDVHQGKVMVMVSWHDIEDGKSLVFNIAPYINNIDVVQKHGTELFAYLRKELGNIESDNVVYF